MLVLAITAAAVVLVTFIVNDLIHEPASLVTLLLILLLSILLDLGWKQRHNAPSRTPVRDRTADTPQP
jgi:hypothetical protein